MSDKALIKSLKIKTLDLDFKSIPQVIRNKHYHFTLGKINDYIIMKDYNVKTFIKEIELRAKSILTANQANVALGNTKFAMNEASALSMAISYFVECYCLTKGSKDFKVSFVSSQCAKDINKINLESADSWSELF